MIIDNFTSTISSISQYDDAQNFFPTFVIRITVSLFLLFGAYFTSVYNQEELILLISEDVCIITKFIYRRPHELPELDRLPSNNLQTEVMVAIELSVLSYIYSQKDSFRR